MQLIGIDIGTLNTKGTLLNHDGQTVCKASIAHSILTPRPGWVEQDAEGVWWAETVEVIRRLVSHPEANPGQIAGIGVSGLFPALLIADKSGKPLRPALLYSDTRAKEELIEFNRIYKLELTSDAVTPKLAWLNKNEHETLDKAQFIFSSHNYIVYRLTGAYCLDYKVAQSFGGLFDHRDLHWRQEVASWAGVKIDRLPDVCSMTEIAGVVTSDAAMLTGLNPGIPVITGSGDSLLTLFSAGVISKGESLLSFGTTGWLAILPFDLEDYVENPGLIRYGAPFLLKGYIATLGALIQWYRDHFGLSESAVASRLGLTAYQILDEEAMRIPPGAEGVIVLPYFLDREEPGAKLPRSGVISGLNLSHKPSHIYRALLESFGFIIRDALEKIDEEGIEISRIVSTGGGVSSKVWRQIVSDIIGRAVHYYPDVDPCLGGAFLSGYSLGWWDSLDWIRNWLPQADITQPSNLHSDAYDKAYKRFLSQRRSYWDGTKEE